MARIRTIKPEFWTSEQVMSCTPTARLLFIGMWNFADDSGVISYSPVQIKAKVFPGDTFSSVEIKTMINELISNDLVRLFRPLDGKLYLFISGWNKHQKIDRPNRIFPVYDSKFEVKNPFDDNSTNDRRVFADNSTNDRRAFDDNSTNDRRAFDDNSTNDRRAFDEHSPPEGNGRERIVMEGKGKGGYRGKNPEQNSDLPDFRLLQISASENLPPENVSPEPEKEIPEISEPVITAENVLPPVKSGPVEKKEKISAQKEKTGLSTQVHTVCQKIFLDFYQQEKRTPYLGWGAKDASHLKLLIGNIMGLIRSHGKEPDQINIPETLAFMLKKLPDIPDRWVYDHLSVANFSSKFNEITHQIINKTNGKRSSNAESRTVGNRQKPGDDYLADILSRLDG